MYISAVKPIGEIMKMLRKSIIVCMLFFVGIVQGMEHEKDYHKYYTKYSDFKLEAAKSEKSFRDKKFAKSCPKKIDGFYFTHHVLERMVERQVSQKDVCWVIRHGDRFCVPKDHFKSGARQFAVDTQKKLGVIIREGNVVITVLIDMNQAALDRELSRWAKKKKAKFSSRKTKV